MTNENSETQVPPKTYRWLPWPLAGLAALVYLLTLNHWITLTSLPYVARLTGWDWHPSNLPWRPAFLEPLYMLVTLPLKFLPSGLRPLAEVGFIERLFPTEWITPDGAGIEPGFLEYAAPLLGPMEYHARLAP